MRLRSLFLFCSLAASAAYACNSTPTFVDGGPGSGPDDGSGGRGLAGGAGKDDIDFDAQGGAGQGDGDDVFIRFESIRVEPGDDTLRVQVGQDATLDFRVIGITAGGEEVDITDRAVFYVPDLFLVGGFPEDGDNVFSIRLPADADDYAQRGGTVTVQAQINNGNDEILTGLTTLNVILEDVVTAEMGSPGATPALPADPAAEFEGDANAAFAPTLVYPNDGVLLPPNLGQLEVHFLPENADNELFQVSFTSPSGEFVYYTRCIENAVDYEDGACSLSITGAEFDRLAATNQGHGPVDVLVRASDEDGSFGESATMQIEFAEERVDGAVYYWSTNAGGTIVRFDFGSGEGVPEDFLSGPGIYDGDDNLGNNGSNPCVGCHALSRQGDKMMLGISNSSAAELVYIADITQPLSGDSPDGFTYNGILNNDELTLLGSFNPEGDSFVSVRRRNAPDDDTKLFFHDTTTGLATSDITLSFVPSHPDWSPVGDMIAVTNISGSNGTTIEFFGGGISAVRRSGGAWDADNPIHIVAPEEGKNRYSPSFVPDGSLLLYTEVDDDTYSGGRADACENGNKFCDGYSDPGAKTWAVVPEASATPVFLANAAAAGVADAIYPPHQAGVGAGDFMDTFPKATPFVTEHRGKKLFWYTVGSQRRAGLRKQNLNNSVVGDPASQALLWMFAIDPEAIENGEDGSYPGFFLPFQDMTTSNHMAQWTERIADAPPPPPAPAPPPPPAVPPPITK